MAGKTLNVLLLEDFLLLVLAVVVELNLVTLFLFCFVLFFFSSKADSTADDASNKLAQV